MVIKTLLIPRHLPESDQRRWKFDRSNYPGRDFREK